MVFAFFMALVGETAGILQDPLRGILATVYLLALAFTNFILQVGLSTGRLVPPGHHPDDRFRRRLRDPLHSPGRDAHAGPRCSQNWRVANRQLSEYAARVEDLTIANERQRMARELHDTLSQGLAGLILQLEAADAHLAAEPPGTCQGASWSSPWKRRVARLQEARQAIDDLRQPAGA